MTAPRTGWPTGTLLGSLSPAAVQDLLALGTLRAFAPGERLIFGGDRADEVFVIVEGYVKVLGDTAHGRSVLLSIRVAGDLVGELAVLTGRPRSASVSAATPVSARAIGRAAFLAHLATAPATAAAVHSAVAGELHRVTRRRIEVHSPSAALRLALTLVYLSEAYGEPGPDGLRIAVPLSQADLASLVGASEPTVRRIIRTLREQRIIRTDYRHQVITDFARLRAFAEEAAESQDRA